MGGQPRRKPAAQRQAEAQTALDVASRRLHELEDTLEIYEYVALLRDLAIEGLIVLPESPPEPDAPIPGQTTIEEHLSETPFEHPKMTERR
jgi:hypothetical protein